MVRLVQRFGLVPYLAAAVLSVTIALLAGVLPVRQYLAQGDRIEAEEVELAALQAESRALRERLAALTDLAVVEAVAREHYGLARPGETVYVVVPAGSASGSAPRGGSSAWLAAVLADTASASASSGEAGVGAPLAAGTSGAAGSPGEASGEASGEAPEEAPGEG